MVEISKLTSADVAADLAERLATAPAGDYTSDGSAAHVQADAAGSVVDVAFSSAVAATGHRFRVTVEPVVEP